MKEFILKMIEDIVFLVAMVVFAVIVTGIACVVAITIVSVPLVFFNIIS